MFYVDFLQSSWLNKGTLSAIRFDKNLEGAMDFRKSYQYFKDNRKAYPNFTPNDFYFGVMTTVVGTIPKGYQWIAI